MMYLLPLWLSGFFTILAHCRFDTRTARAGSGLVFGVVVFFAFCCLVSVGSLLGSVAVAVLVTVKVASGAAVVPALSEIFTPSATIDAEPPTIPTPSATTDAMIRVGQPNRFGFFGCA